MNARTRLALAGDVIRGSYMTTIIDTGDRVSGRWEVERKRRNSTT